MILYHKQSSSNFNRLFVFHYISIVHKTEIMSYTSHSASSSPSHDLPLREVLALAVASLAFCNLATRAASRFAS